MWNVLLYVILISVVVIFVGPLVLAALGIGLGVLTALIALFAKLVMPAVIVIVIIAVVCGLL